MKRCRYGAAALVLLLILGLLSSRRMEKFCAEVADEVSRAGIAEDWSTAEALTDRAQKSWDRGRSLAAVLSDHDPLEQVDSLLALLDTALNRRDGPVFSDICTQLVQTLNALSEAHQLNFENLL